MRGTGQNNTLGLSLGNRYRDVAWRHCALIYKPDNGDGAKKEGGRFNYKGTPVLYLCTTEDCSEAERHKSITNKRDDAVAAKTTVKIPDHGLYRFDVDLYCVL